MTDKQKETLRQIKDMTRRRGFPPTLRELMVPLGVSLNAVRARLSQLERHGKIRIEPRTARGITVR